jgi:hypothetical protein
MNSFIISIGLTGYELSSDDEELPQEHDARPDWDTMPRTGVTGQPILQQPISKQPPPSFDFSDIMRRSGGSITSMFSVIREIDALLPPGPIVVYSERAGGSMRLHILHIKHIVHILPN